MNQTALTRMFSFFLILACLIFPACSFDLPGITNNNGAVNQAPEDIHSAPPPGAGYIAATSQNPAIVDGFEIIDYGFVQQDKELTYGFKIKNLDDNTAYENSRFQVFFKDSAGNIVDSEEGYINQILAGEIRGVGGNAYLESTQRVSDIEITIQRGDQSMEEPLMLTQDEPDYYPGEYSNIILNKITNQEPSLITSIRVDALAYNAAGKIIGGGISFLEFIEPNSSSGVSVYIKAGGIVDHVETFISLTSLSSLFSQSALSGSEFISINQSGWGQNNNWIGYGIILTNNNPDYSITNSRYHATFYNATGDVIAVSYDYINMILPKQTMGIANTSLMPVEDEIDSMEIQVLPGDLENSAYGPFTGKNAALESTGYSLMVVGDVLNPLSENVSDLLISAITFDSAGNINGGGYTYLDYAAVDTLNPVEITVTAEGAVDHAEIYAAWTSISAFQ